jgi:hypothetical protein
MSMANGADAKVKDWSRLYLSGMGHCSGGGAALDTLTCYPPRSVGGENAPPDSVTALGVHFRTQPPPVSLSHAQYNGSGGPETLRAGCRR